MKSLNNKEYAVGNKIVLNVEGVSQWFGNNKILNDVNIKIIQGQFVALVGPSGCGKTTLFNAILGTCPPKKGIIETNGMQVTGPNRNVGVVYQKYGLYQFLTAEKNVAFGPMLDTTEWYHRFFMPWYWIPLRKKQLQEARDFLTKVKLGHIKDNYPSEMSGGQQQRVAIAQSLIMRPKILLLDEPFGALDESTRESLQKMLLHLYAENLEAKKNGEDPPWTVLFITHELTEAFYIGDRVIGLSRNWYQDTENGRINGDVLGATKVWDKSAPVYHPDAPRDFELFHRSKQELREIILSDKSPIVQREAHVSFWEDLQQGVGTGVAITKRKAK